MARHRLSSEHPLKSARSENYGKRCREVEQGRGLGRGRLRLQGTAGPETSWQTIGTRGQLWSSRGLRMGEGVEPNVQRSFFIFSFRGRVGDGAVVTDSNHLPICWVFCRRPPSREQTLSRAQ